MPPYIHFTDEQKERAASVDLEEMLRHRGERLLRSGHDKRLSSDHSITIRGNEWFDHSTSQGGHAISFVQNYYGMSYQDAVLYLLGDSIGKPFPPAKEKQPETKKEFLLPETNRDMRRVFAYLVKQRCIDREVVTHFAKERLLYEDAKYHNAVFVGMDNNGIPRHAHKRSTYSLGKAFRINVEGSDPHYSFHHKGNNEQLYVFEAPIDMLSYISMNKDDWQSSSYVACCGTSPLPVIELLTQLPQISMVHLCLDNDKGGHVASRNMEELLLERGVCVDCLTPSLKDWNEDLVDAYEHTQEVNNHCMEMT